MEGHELTPSDRSSPANNSEVKKFGKVKHSLSNEWTDEKHNNYLNTIEASFVSQLYNNEHLSTDLMCWLSRTKKKTDSAQSTTNKQQSNQFKVLRQGCWEKLEFERPMSRVVTGTELVNQLANPWIQHFVSPGIGNDRRVSLGKVEDENFAMQSILNNPMKEKVLGAKHLSDCHSFLFHQNSTGIRTGSGVLQLFPEASDQNFVDMEHESVPSQTKASTTKKRVREGSAHSMVNDQIVPSKPIGASSSPKSVGRAKEKIAEHTSGTSYYNHKEPDGLGFNTG